MKTILSKIFGPDPDTLEAYRHMIPKQLRITHSEDDGFIISRIVEINGEAVDESELLITQSRDNSEVLRNVNDLVMTYCDVPLELRRYYENILEMDGVNKQESVLVKA